MAESIENLPFDEFIRYLNGGYYLDTFEVGSVKIDPISWPTSSRDRKPKHQSDIVDEILNRPWIDPEKFTGKITCARNQTQNLSKKEDNLSCKVKKMVKKVSVSNSPEKMQSEEERKLECSKRKQREQYEVIENEKKKRRIQIIDILRPQPTFVQSPVKKQQKKMGSDLTPADEGKAEKKVNSEMPPIRKVIKITCARNQTQNLSKKEENVSCQVKKMVKKVCVSNSPEKLQSEEERKLEYSKRKLRERYELIENEKKKRRIQIIDFVKPQPPCSQPQVK